MVLERFFGERVTGAGNGNWKLENGEWVDRVKRVCPVIYAYGDDGGDEKRERVIAVSLIAGYEEWWQEIEQRWLERCDGIPFHATDCESNHGDYEHISHDDAKAMYRDLTRLLAD